MLGVHMAAAQSTPTPQSEVPNPPSYCKASTLTGKEFMQSIQAIIAHGDLTDVAFNEKTLDTKFTADPYWEAYSLPNPQILHLSSDQVLGSKIHTEVIVFKAKSQELKAGFIAGLGFVGPPNFIADCLHIPISHFASFF